MCIPARTGRCQNVTPKGRAGHVLPPQCVHEEAEAGDHQASAGDKHDPVLDSQGRIALRQLEDSTIDNYHVESWGDRFHHKSMNGFALG